MKLSQAASYFNTVPVDGWNGSAWVPSVVSGNFLTYDRFLGPRTFGHKQRMLLVGGDAAELMPYEVTRTPEGDIYLILSNNQDMKGEEVYATNFLLQRAPFMATIIRFDTTAAPSGLGGSKVDTALATYHCDMERFSSEAARDVDLARYPIFNIFLPLTALAVLDTDMELEVDSVRYEIREIENYLDAALVRALKRGADV